MRPVDSSKIKFQIIIVQILSMEFNLSPQKPDTTVVDTDGGAYHAWTAATSPVLATAALGAGKLVLHPRGFALPHYSDSNKIGYVIQGECTAGFVSPNCSDEKVLIIKEGTAIPVPMGVTSWWYNARDVDVIVVFLGETSHSYTPGLFNYFFLTGTLGVLAGFSTEFLTKIYNLPNPDAVKLASSQTSPLIVTLVKNVNIPYCKDHVFNLASGSLPPLDGVRLSCGLVRAEPGAVAEGYPSYSADASHRIMYVTKGGGQVQIVGLNGEMAMDAAVEEGYVFVVPKFFTAAPIAGDGGMEFFWVSTSLRAVNVELTSVWKGLSAPILQAALNVSPELVKIFQSKIIGE